MSGDGAAPAAAGGLRADASLADFVESAPNAVAMFDRDMRYLCASARWRSDYGLGTADLRGRSHYEVFPDLPVRWRDLHRRGLAGELLSADLDRFDRVDGTTRWLRWEIRPWRSGGGSIGGIVLFTEDVTEAVRSVETVRASEARHLRFIEELPDAVWIKRRGRIVFVNRAGVALFGARSAADLVGRTPFDLIHPASLAAARRRLERLSRGPGRRIGVTEIEIVRFDGALRQVEISGASFLDDGELAIEAVLRDVTERRRAEAQVRALGERLELMVEGTQTGLWDWDLATDRVTYSREWKRLLGYDDHEVADRLDEWRRLTHPDDAEVALARVAAYLANPRGTLETEFRMRHADGGWRWVLSRATAALDEAGRPVRLLGFHLDVTERKRVEVERRILAQRLLAAQEEERRRVAGELHDELGQVLTAVKLNLRSAAVDRRGVADGPFASAIAAVDRAIAGVRNLVVDLRPPLLDDLGLVPALRWLLERAAREAGLAATMACAEEERFPAEVETVCFRVVQEALTNVARHAGASAVRLELRRDDERLRLLLRDDGRGFDVEEARREALAGRALGLSGMRERVETAGGTLELCSRPGSGSEIRVEMPLPERSRRAP